MGGPALGRLSQTHASTHYIYKAQHTFNTPDIHPQYTYYTPTRHSTHVHEDLRQLRSIDRRSWAVCNGRRGQAGHDYVPQSTLTYTHTHIHTRAHTSRSTSDIGRFVLFCSDRGRVQTCHYNNAHTDTSIHKSISEVCNKNN